MKQKSSQSQSWRLWSQSPANKSDKLDQSAWRSLLLKQGWLAGMKMNRIWSMLCWFPQLTPTKPEILHTGWYITWKIYSQTREQQMGTKTEREVDALLTHLFQVFLGQGKRLSSEFKQREGGFLLPLFLILLDGRTPREEQHYLHTGLQPLWHICLWKCGPIRVLELEWLLSSLWNKAHFPSWLPVFLCGSGKSQGKESPWVHQGLNISFQKWSTNIIFKYEQKHNMGVLLKLALK